MDLSIGLGIENSNIECLYLRASCYHAIGEYGEAVLMSFLFLIFLFFMVGLKYCSTILSHSSCIF